jgi:tetratricopeptide (TPR) repeat protein
LNNLGITLKGLDRIDDAIIQFEKAIEIDPNDPSSFYNLGITLKDKNRAYAIKNFEKAIEINPKNAEFYLQLGEAPLSS